MANYTCVVHQEPDGLWGFYDKFDTPHRLTDGGYTTREQAEREAERFTYRMHKGDEIEEQIKERVAPLIVAWADQLVSESGLERQDVLLDIRLGVRAALDELCPSG